MPNTPLMYTDLLGNVGFGDSLQSASQSIFQMLPEQDYFYTNKSLEGIFCIDLQEVFKGFCEDFVLYEMHNGLDMWL